MHKKIIIIFSFFFMFVKSAYAQDATVLIINQIRGPERCCEPGSLDLLNKISANNTISSLPIGWAVRYDALVTKGFTERLAKEKELGLLLEITPSLAKASNVKYKGLLDGYDWYFAKNTFLIGYTVPERKKMIDTVFQQFKGVFGYYPHFTVSWMIDAWSLSYIQEAYKVTMHELTKEQYETDSYTLYGGIFNAPYYPARTHPLLPGTDTNRLDLVIVRQTSSDLIYNYGSARARYTTQPNDYLNSYESHDFSYFRSLVEDALSQKSGIRIIVLGLENSTTQKTYTEEFIRQLELVSSLQRDKKLTVENPYAFATRFRSVYRKNSPFFLLKDFTPGGKSGVLWYFGNRYRARIILKDQMLILDDLRSFIASESDPYMNGIAQADYAYWIISYLIDGSQQHIVSKEQKDELNKHDLLHGNVLPDVFTSPFGLYLGKGLFSIRTDGPSIEISFSGGSNGSVKLLPDEIVIDKRLDVGFTDPYPYKIADLYSDKKEKKLHFDKQLDFVIKPDADHLGLGWIRDDTFIRLFSINKKDNEYHLLPDEVDRNLELLNPILQPDKERLKVDKEHSILYWNNTEAIAGRNPVRMFILPQNTYGRPTRVSKATVSVTNEQNIHIAYPADYSYRIAPWFIDITADKPVKTQVTVNLDGVDLTTEIPIEFLPDCQKNIKKCIVSPGQFIKYFMMLFQERKETFIIHVKDFSKKVMHLR